MYLDYRLVDEQVREAANEQYKYSVEEMVQDENVAQRKQEEFEKKEAERQLHKVHEIEKSLESFREWLEVAMFSVIFNII